MVFISPFLWSLLVVLLLSTIATLAQALDFTCPGICLTEGESMLNEAESVQVDGTRPTTGSCKYFDTQNQNVTYPSECQANADAAAAAGCKCGIPVDCPGICLTEGETVLNEAEDVQVYSTTATCRYFDDLNEEIVDSEVCAENSQMAQEAGCKCGIPTECPGICPEGESMLNEGDNVKVGDTTGTCGYFNSQNEDVIDSEVCLETAIKANEAGCKCTGTLPPTPAPGSGTSGSSSCRSMVASVLLVMGLAIATTMV